MRASPATFPPGYGEKNMRRFRIAMQGSRLREEPNSLAEHLGSHSVWRDRVDVAIVGGGIFGVSLALFLARGGAKVAVFEKGVVAGEASGRAVGFVESLMTDPRKQPALHHTKTIWKGLSDLVGEDTSFRSGMAVVFSRAKEMEVARQWRALSDLENDARLLDPTQMRRLIPEISPAFDIAGGIYSPTDGYADPRRATPAIARGAVRAGALIHENCAVRRVLVEDRRIAGVETERGMVKAERVVLAGGIWNQILCAHLDIALPQLYGFATATEIRAPELPFSLAGVVNDCCFRPTPWGSHVVGPHLSISPLTPLHLRHGWRFRKALAALGAHVDLSPAPEHFAFIAKALRWRRKGESPFEKCRILEPEYRRYSEWYAIERIKTPFGISNVELLRSWAGALALTPDNMPILDDIEQIGGLSIGTGMYYGFTFSPGMADCWAAQLLGRPLPFDRSPFALSRFSAGKEPDFAW